MVGIPVERSRMIIHFLHFRSGQRFAGELTSFRPSRRNVRQKMYIMCVFLPLRQLKVGTRSCLLESSKETLDSHGGLSGLSGVGRFAAAL